MKEFQASSLDIGKRLDKFLAEKLSDISRSQIKKHIKSGNVLVNKKAAKVHEFLKEGDIIELRIKNKESRIKEKMDAAYIFEPKIIFKDNDYIVIEKPSMMLAHPAAVEHAKEITLTNWLIAKFPEIKSVGEYPERPGIVHRLDKDVSGIMLVAKTRRGYNHLKEQFQIRRVKKQYWALVYGIVEKEGEISLPIGRSKKGKFVAHPQVRGEKFKNLDRWAKTIFSPQKHRGRFTELKVEIVTGRTHQIRAHFSAIGHPVVGDREYGPKKNFFRLFSRKIKVLDAPRVMLHAQKIGFFDLENKWVEYESPLSEEIITFINTL